MLPSNKINFRLSSDDASNVLILADAMRRRGVALPNRSEIVRMALKIASAVCRSETGAATSDHA